MSAAWCLCAFLVNLLYGVRSEGPVSVAFNENPIYNDSQLSVACTFVPNFALSAVTMDAFNGTRKEGSLYCSVAEGDTSATGVFSGSGYTGCPNFVSRSGRVAIVMRASPMLELQYKCTVKVHNGSEFYDWTSDAVQLHVKVLPSVPKFATERLVYNEKNNVTVECESRSGTPSADLSLTLRTTSGELVASSAGRGSVQLNLSALRSFHNAVAKCEVTNHHFANMTVTRPIIINHIASVHRRPLETNTYSSNHTFNCSAEIVVFPEATYHWSVSPDKTTSNLWHRNSSTLTVLQGQSGTFNCTATNIITLETVLVTYVVISSPQTNEEKLTNTAPKLSTELLSATVTITVIVITIVAAILYIFVLRKKLRNGMTSSVPQASPQLNDNTHITDEEMHMVGNPLYYYAPSTAQPTDGLEFNEGRRKSSSITQNESASLIKSMEPTVDVQLQNGEDSSEMQKPCRLLIAAEGAAANVKRRILSTTVLVEYCDQSCSLDSIVAKLTEGCSMASRPVFQSVALLLRRAKVGATVSELDQSVLTGKTVMGKTLREFFTRLTDVALNKLAGSTRIDILNYGSSDGAQLATELTGWLKVPVTVSDDLFGVNTATSQEGGCDAKVADDYFDRNRLDEVIYADIEIPVIQQQLRPQRKVEKVVYSDVALKT